MRKGRPESLLGQVGRLARGRRPRKGYAGGREKPNAVGILAFEVSVLMSKAAQLWRALEDGRLACLRNVSLRHEGVRRLVSHQDDVLVSLVLTEITDALAFLVGAVSRLSRRCTDPLLQGFDAAYADLVKNGADPFCFEYAGRKMERKVKKMERFVLVGVCLHRELQTMSELKQNLRLTVANPDACRRLHPGAVAELKNKVLWQKQQVKLLRDDSLWVRTFDYVTRLLCRSLFSIVGRIRLAFGGQPEAEESSTSGLPVSLRSPVATADQVFAGQCFPVPGRGSSLPPPGSIKILTSTLEPRLGLPNAPPATVGAAALAPHFARVILAIQKHAASPCLIDPYDRDELYSMLTSSMKTSLRVSLKPKAKSPTPLDPGMAAERRAAMDRTLEWLAPLAKNTVKWHQERNFEKESLVPSYNVYLVQTLYFANQRKTEEAIVELLVGLDFLWRYGREVNERAVAVCSRRRKKSSFKIAGKQDDRLPLDCS
ncbi:protein PSK SIMULATOR 1-like [Zingiber officinale]|uniref:DUF668 domain-containing protein n=1 Tax=Zingiber officinale TaxID=94328 RepID=A0A8J5GRV2_ZINOF|nr:protein PSK SIMULATOR 1-like [Zingiber officinale]KAG6512690.1 hypothetical protein ZIOFF_030819 [Zingiber officinale]